MEISSLLSNIQRYLLDDPNPLAAAIDRKGLAQIVLKTCKRPVSGLEGDDEKSQNVRDDHNEFEGGEREELGT